MSPKNKKPVTHHATQASKVFARFGGVPTLHAALTGINKPRDISAIYRWDRPAEAGGTGGLIPSSALQDVITAARYEGVVLTDRDLAPR